MGSRGLVLSIMVLLTVLSFQNCSQQQGVNFTELSSKVTNDKDETGTHYDGKIYVLTGEVCPDGTSLRARIIVHSAANAQLVRQECNEISPVALGPNDFEINAANPRELFYQQQTFVDRLVGNKLDVSSAFPDGGYCYMMHINFGTPADTSTWSGSLVQIYEDGLPLGPAHSAHADIRNIGLGRFSDKWGGVGSTDPVLRFSSSDNTDPRTNGRIYSWGLRQ